MRWKWLLGGGAFLMLTIMLTVAVLRYADNALKPQIAQAVKSATGRELTLDGDVTIVWSWPPTLVIEDVRLQNASWASQPHLATLRRLEVQLALWPLLKGTIEITRLVLVDPALWLETTVSGVSNLEFATSNSTRKPPDLTLKEVRLSGGHLTYYDGRSDRTYVVALNQLRATSSGLDHPIHLTLHGVYQQAAFSTTGTLGSLNDLLNPATSWPLDLTATLGATTASLKGKVREPLKFQGFDLTILVQSGEPNQIADQLGITWPQAHPVSLAGHFTDPAPHTYRLTDLTATIGPHAVEGTIEMSLNDPSPQLTVTVSAHHLDLRPLFAGLQTGPRAALPRTRRLKLFSRTPLPLNVLPRYVSASVDLHIDRLVLPQVAFDDLSAIVTLQEGRITLKPLTAKIGGGRMTASLALHPQDHLTSLDVGLQVAQFDIRHMRQALQLRDDVKGKWDIDLHLKGRGQSVAALMASLNGSSQIVMQDGRIANRSMDLLGADLASSLLRLLQPGRQQTAFTDIHCAVSRFTITDGYAASEALIVDTQRTSLVGKGHINLKTERLDLALKPFPKEGAGLKGVGKLGLSAGELAKPFKLKGTLARPALALDPLPATWTVGKAVGGIVLLGPVGIAAALLHGSADDDNKCLAALESAKRGVQVKVGAPAQPKPRGIKKTTTRVGKEIKGVGRTFRRLFRHRTPSAPLQQAQTEEGEEP